jgi:hypothetical protein
LGAKEERTVFDPFQPSFVVGVADAVAIGQVGIRYINAYLF